MIKSHWKVKEFTTKTQRDIIRGEISPFCKIKY